MNGLLLAFLSGATGAMIGGTASFIVTGFVGILVVVMQSMGYQATLLNDQVLNLVFMPCICFNGAVAAMAFAANVRHHPMNGADGNRSLYFTGDPIILIIGGIFGVFGYLLFSLFNAWQWSLDIGALVVLSLNIVIRILFGTHHYIHRSEKPLFRKETTHFWLFQLLFSGIIALLISYFVEMTGMASIGFSISAMTLIFAFSNPEFPATHHITLVAGYAMMATHQYYISIIFGILAQIIFIVFTNYFNTDLDTHIDGPAAAIAPLSFIIFTFF